MRVPNHIAIILDGNGRWAKKRGMPRSFGHVKGCENLEDICEVAKELGVKYLTVYAFSTENWKRSKEEVDGLMKLFRNYLKKCIKISQKNNMRVKVIGDITAFDSDIQESIEKLEDFSKDFTDLHFQIALNYGSRDEITRAVNRMLRLSNYLLWQLAYSEFYFTDVPWPDFKKEELVKAIEKYNERDRRYGGVKEE